MKNQELAKIFNEIAEYWQMEGVQFKPQAYEKAALNLETLSEDIEDIYRRGGIKGLKNIGGIGESIARHIEEYLKTGQIKEFEAMKKKMPANINELTRVEGIGPKMVKELYEKLKIKNLADLEKAAKAGKLRNLPKFGEKKEKNILEGIEFLKREHGRFRLGDILPVVNETLDKLKKLKEVEEISTAGSIRRRKETIGDVDLLVISKKPEPPADANAMAGKIMDYFVKLPGVVKIWGTGKTKSSVRIRDGFDMDIRVVPQESFGAALQYFTGSKEHNVALRKIAIDKGYKLNEYGLFKGLKMIAARSEKEIYEKLGLEWMPPEMRENRGEIELAQKGELPKLIELKDIRGDLHCHSDWNGGTNSISEIAEAAMSMGYEYIGISDHTKFLQIEHGLDENKIIRRNKAIGELNKKYISQKFRILKGCEANIMTDGSIDIKDEVLAQLDFVIAGVHSSFKLSREDQTKRMIRAMKNPNVDIISHPTGRLILKRDEYQIDFEAILKTAKKTGTILEINAHPWRLDLNDLNIRRAKDAGVKMIINTDAHHNDQLHLMEYGVSQARRGFAEKKDIVNTFPVEKLLSFFKH